MTKTKLAIFLLALTNLSIIAVLLVVRSHAKEHLELTAKHLEALAYKEIEYTVKIDAIIPFSSEIELVESFTVEVELTIDDNIQIKADIPIKDAIQVPVDIRAKQNVELDTTIMITEEVMVNLDTEIPIDQKFLWPIGKKGKGIKIPVIASVPVNENVLVEFSDPLAVQATIAVDIPFQQMIDVEFEMWIPIDQDVPVNFPLKTEAKITIPKPIKVKGEIPVKLEVPVRIPLNETTIKASADSISYEIRQMFPF